MFERWGQWLDTAVKRFARNDNCYDISDVQAAWHPFKLMLKVGPLCSVSSVVAASVPITLSRLLVVCNVLSAFRVWNPENIYLTCDVCVTAVASALTRSLAPVVGAPRLERVCPAWTARLQLLRNIKSNPCILIFWRIDLSTF